MKNIYLFKQEKRRDWNMYKQAGKTECTYLPDLKLLDSKDVKIAPKIL